MKWLFLEQQIKKKTMPFSRPNKMVPEIIAKTAGFPLNNGQVHGESTLCMTKQRQLKNIEVELKRAPLITNYFLNLLGWLGTALFCNFCGVETLPTFQAYLGIKQLPTTVEGCYVVSTTDPLRMGYY
jgi:hypothetical protein